MDTFDLNDNQLLPIAASIYGAPVRSCRMEDWLPMNRGGCGLKATCSLVLTTLDGREISAPLFLKKFSWKGKSEAAHYRHLAGFSLPTPRLYGSIPHADGDEILFLERLTQIGVDRSNEEEWRQLLSLLARLNACGITPDYLPHLHAFEQGGRIDGWWITGFSPFPPATEEIEAALRLCGVSESELPGLSLAALKLCESVAAQPQGLVHQDFLADNLGWRGERAELVVFDLHKCALGPRFADAAPYLGLPDWSDTFAYLDYSPSRRQALTDHYLQEFERYSGNRVLPEEFCAECSALFWAHKVAILWWMAQQRDTERIGQVLKYLRALTI